MDLDQTQAIYDYEEEEEEEKDKQTEAHRKKKEAAHLKVFSQQGFKETVFPVFQGDNFIGRDGKCNITIPIKALSKKHACIEVQRDLHLIHDCESKNRTKKGKLFLKPTIRYELRHGDMLTLGDVRCQYLVEVDTEEDEGDETGSETGSESMRPEVTTEEEQHNDKPIVSEEATNKDDIPREDTVEPLQDYKLPKQSKDDEDAYAADTDSDTDEERLLAAAVMPTVLYSSEDEREAPARQKATSIPSKQNSSMEGQTLAFGLGSPDNIFRNRESSGSGASHTGLTGSSVPPTLMLTSESDVQSDDKADLSSDNKQTSPRHPAGARVSETQPTCQPTLLYDSGSDDVSPIKRPRHPEARIVDKQDHPRPCEPTLLYGSESEEGSPIKRPGHPGISNALPILDESDSEEEIDKALPDSSVVKKIADSAPGEGAGDNEAEFKEADATLPYAAGEFSSTDDEDETVTTSEDQKTNCKKPMAHKEPTLVFNTEDLRREETRDGKDNMVSDDYGEDSATQPYASDSNFESESDPLPFMGSNEADTSPGKQAGKPLDLEATQAYFVDDDGEEEKEERDSDSSDSQPLPIGPTCTAMADGDDVAATLAYGLEATQAYNVTDKDVDSNSGDERRSSGDDTKTPINDVPATQAYGVGASDDEEEEDNRQQSDKVRYEEQSGGHKINRGDRNQPTVPYGLEATQAYGADHDETDDEDSNDQDNVNEGENQGRANKATYLAETLPYGGDGDDDDDAEAHEVTKPFARQANQVTLADGLEATQAYDGDNNGEESAPSGEIEATQAYGIEEPSDDELQAQVEQSSQRAKTTTKKKVAFVSSFQESSEVSEKGKSQTEAVLTSSSASTTEQTDGSTSRSPEDEIPVSTPATRKGRRGAMRLTIEPGEGEGEEAQETSTRRRGRKGVKVSNDQQKDNKKGAATPGVHNKGRKRGRPAAKSLTAPEAGEQRSVEVEETPAPKSRRGRRGKMAEAATVSVSETPLSKPAGEGAASEAAGSQKSTALVAETPGAHRRGRGRGQKSVTVKEVAQVMEVAETEKEQEPVNSQSETLVEATPSKGRGRGKGRGKKKQSSAVNINEALAEDAPVPMDVIPDEVEVKPDITTPARSKSRAKGKGKKTQPVNNESEVTETAVGSRDKSHPPESPAVAASRQGRRKRAEPSAMELESPEDTSEMLSHSGSREGSQTRKGRGKEKVSRESTEQGPSSELEVEETPAKKSRRGKEPLVSQSPSLRQGKLAGSSNPKVIFTGLVDKQGEKVVTSLGGELVDDVHSCTHLVTDKVRRTVKFLCGLAGGKIIALPSWLDACKRAKSFVDTSPFLVKDKDAEKQYKFDLQRSHEVAVRQGLLAGYRVHVTKKVKPEPSQMKDIIQSAKGEFLSSMPRGKEERVFVISCEEDRGVCKKTLGTGIPVVSAEVLLTGILRQQLDLEEYKLFAEETSGISQETSTSSGQSKRRREPSATGSLASTSEAKVAGSKRRKR